MGTLFHYGEMLPASDAESRDKHRSKRHVEIFTINGDHEIHLRIGKLNHEHMGNGYSVQLREKDARELMKGLERAMNYIGYKTT